VQGKQGDDANELRMGYGREREEKKKEEYRCRSGWLKAETRPKGVFTNLAKKTKVNTRASLRKKWGGGKPKTLQKRTQQQGSRGWGAGENRRIRGNRHEKRKRALGTSGKTPTTGGFHTGPGGDGDNKKPKMQNLEQRRLRLRKNTKGVIRDPGKKKRKKRTWKGKGSAKSQASGSVKGKKSSGGVLTQQDEKKK